MRDYRRGEWLFLLAACLLTAAACFPWMPNLGMEYDEAHFLESATRIAATHPERLKVPDGVYLANRPFPFMTMVYVGALDGWLMAPVLAIFGFSPVVPRVAYWLAGCLVLWLAYGLARRLGGMWAGVVAVSFLVVDLEWLLHVPTHFGPFFLQIIAATVAYWRLDRWLVDGRPRDFYIACFVAGLAFQEKLTFVWVLAVLVLALLVFRGREVLRTLRPLQFGIGFALFLLGAAPVLWYVIAHRDIVFGYGGQSTALPTAEIVEKRLYQWQDLLNGQRFMIQQLGDPIGVVRYSALPWIFWGSLVACAALRVWAAAPLLFFTVGLVALNTLFPEGGRAHHLLLVYPLMQCGIGVVAARSRWLLIPVLVLLGLTGLSTAQNLAWYTQEVARTGGRGHWSSAINDVADWIKTQPDKHFAAASWGFYRQLYFLTAGRISLHDRYFDLMPDPLPPDNLEQITSLVQRQDTIWLTSSFLPQYVTNQRKLFGVAAGLGLTPRHLKTFYRKTGEPIYEAYAFLPEQTAPWRPLTVSANGARRAEFLVPPGTREVAFHASGRAWHHANAVTVELLDASGARLRAWWRTTEAYPITPLEERMSFGKDRYPDYFVPLPGARDGEVAQVRFNAETEKPVDLQINQVRVR
ncbi:MAG: glycosyltransferase family 39 protein [Acidobacteria bacterium]|nr:glycosyltransferase family 39 protein [Acidobacteriota bacterium]